MGEWTLKAGQLNIIFLSTKSGALGVKFNSGKETGHNKFFAPALTKAELPKFNPKNPQDKFHDVRYAPEDSSKHYRSEEITRKYYDKENATVMITTEQMAQMYPLTKEAKVVSKQPMTKLQLTNISASDGYYLIPKRDFENIQKYKKMIEFIGTDFVLTNPMRLRVRSVTAHNYAIFVDQRQNALVAIEVLVKTGMQPEPAI